MSVAKCSIFLYHEDTFYSGVSTYYNSVLIKECGFRPKGDLYESNTYR